MIDIQKIFYYVEENIYLFHDIKELRAQKSSLEFRMN